MNKKLLSERDICTKFITPALEAAGWDMLKQFREEVNFTDGRIMVRGKLSTRGKKKRADYILYFKPNIPIGIIEVKDNNHEVSAGMQQGLEYADILNLPFVFATNGDRFIFHDKTNHHNIETEIALENFPSPELLWNKYLAFKGILTEEAKKVVEQDYFFDGSGRSPRYYQQNAINLTLEAIAKGQNRILLVMATGTGKTYTAFQIVHRLWKSKTKKRVLFLADRNALIDQTKRGDFKHFKDKMTIVEKRQVDKSYEIYLAIYQGLTGNEDEKNIFKQFSQDFFDLIVIDECHRGSANEDSAWREVLQYFHSATQIGLTATPKETDSVSNSEYFGDPVFTYTLKQGIEDGFLAPYQVIRVSLDIDLEGWRPEKNKKDKQGELVDDRIYNRKDYDRNLVIDERTQIVAEKITEFLKNTYRFNKTIVFCRDVDHAERMRSALASLNSDLVAQNHKYIMRITGDNDEGKRELDNFIDPEQTYPVIATTSELMTTGVDAQTCKLIVLDTEIGSMTKFKQIVGRGTRVNEEFGKLYFTILDFRNATDNFADPSFDGDVTRVKEIKENTPADDNFGDEEIPEDDQEKETESDTYGNKQDENPFTEKKQKASKVYVNNVDVTILNTREMYFDKDGKPVTISLKDFSKQLIHEEFKTLDNFLNMWTNSDRKEAIIKELQEQGIPVNELLEAVNKECDLFDIICHVAFDQPPLTRKERANNVKKRNYFTKYADQTKAVLEALIDKYADEGIENIESMEILKVNPISEYGSPLEIIKLFGGRNQYLDAVKELEKEIYSIA
ncbi:DEAD/DEAH box helicase family protein [Elizabethkingia meningoseptica]|uniref:EcoAI/FtnUII family type I restriction enzme subunit R n=1 Tax=Elizabethkingia meningoseptica TaxID=238 RepID=UPI0023AE7355|nr:DEAD/DEAH box helicase family protein [Elizabethkingia meningoseptica]MDE5437275.1 DEAD/DEAH box helicase family protein [Elizabethkingia meningoseptica]MDE5510377.1 DEAD/DEAH box helicase family protein [Elizabethkingia meningoseptica]MDE5514216.1 DEAD/DEAH box helicase family protein [Elizabethkingia meningoseptica]MDE5524863.1 DEAD/DEAH box helicase family protein [Elizabethkingia meningoseptica]MDE5528427.1 DEAD/DEAH box helicase family protein [Elizabethkingia meningoseptica]